MIRMRDESRERALENELSLLFDQWWHELESGGRNDKFWQMIDPHCKNYKGGVWMVRHLLYDDETNGVIKRQNPLDSTVEGLVLGGEWDDLFDDYDKLAARKRLQKISK